MFNGIKAYQKANKLKVDGVMKPGGETEQSMNKRVAEAQAAERARHDATARRKDRRDALRRDRGRAGPDGDKPNPYGETVENYVRSQAEEKAKKKYLEKLTGIDRRRETVKNARHRPRAPGRSVVAGWGSIQNVILHTAAAVMISTSGWTCRADEESDDHQFIDFRQMVASFGNCRVRRHVAARGV
ncbi:MAG: hypothetical protein KAH11_03545 [Rhodospirillales bacterium]|nr:hypothetical protein [Rhodospirillales bacterium]